MIIFQFSGLTSPWLYPINRQVVTIQAPDFFASRVALYTDKASPNGDSERSQLGHCRRW